MTKWITSYSAFRTLPSPDAPKYSDLPANTRVEPLGIEMNGYEQVNYDSKAGWVLSANLENYIENYPKNCVDLAGLQTSNLNDAEQYIHWNGYDQYNMCGEMCAAYFLNIPLRDFLETWKIKAPSLFARIFGTGRARGTGSGELAEMLDLFGVKTAQLSPTFKRYTPNALAELAGKNIVSVRINSYTGRLQGSGVLHWVVVTNVIQERQGYGLVEVYNPFPNRIEVYSWAEFIASARVPYGIRKEK